MSGGNVHGVGDMNDSQMTARLKISYKGLIWGEDREEGEILHDSTDWFFEGDVEVIFLWSSPSGKA